MRVRGNLLKKVALASAAWTQFDQIVVALDERRHADQRDHLRTFGKRRRLQSYTAQQEPLPLRAGKFVAPPQQRTQHIGFRELNGPQAVYSERAPILLLSDGCVIAQRDLGIKAVGQHTFVLFHQVIVDADVPQRQAGEFGDERIGPGVEPRLDDVDQLDGASIPGPRLEQLFLAGADSSIGELPFDDRQSVLDLLLIGRGAVTSEHKLHDVGGKPGIGGCTCEPGLCGPDSRRTQ